MGRLRKIGLWSLAAVTLIAWIPYATCGSTPKTAIKIVKPPTKPTSQEKLPAASRRQQQTIPLSVEDEENFSGQRPSFAPFPPGFTQGAPPRYTFSNAPDSPSDRYDTEDAPSGGEHGMGFMAEFGPPKGFPDLSKLTGGEFGKMEAPSHGGSIETGYTQGTSSSKYRPFAQFSPQGGSQYYDDSDDGPSEAGFGAGPSQSVAQPQNAPKRKPFRNGRPSFAGGRPNGFGGPGGQSGPSGPGPFGAPEGIGGPGPYGAPEGIYGGGPGPYGPGSDGPSRPFGPRPSRPGGPFGGSSDGPSSRPGLFGSPDGPSSRPGHFGSDGPSSRPDLFGGSSDGPSGGPSHFGPSGSPDGPSGRPVLFGPGGSSDGPGRPLLFGGSSDGPSSRPNSPFSGIDGPPSGGPYDSSDGPSRPGPSFISLDSSSRPGPFGGPSNRPGPFGGPSNRPGPYGAPGGGPDGPGPNPFNGGKHESSPVFSFQNSSPGQGFRLSRGYPRFHPNQIHNDDFKESADNGDYTPYNNGPSQFNYPPRQQANFGQGPDDFEQGPGQFNGPRPRRPEFSSPHHRQQQQPQQQQQPLGSSYGQQTHRFDSPRKPYVIKAEDKENQPSEDVSPKAKNHLVKSRTKRDLEERHLNATAKTSSTPCKSNKENGCRGLSSTGNNKKQLSRRGSTVPRVRKTVRRNSNVTRLVRTGAEDPMIADGTQQTGFWDVSPGFGTYNAFKKQGSRHHVRSQDRHDEYDDGDEEVIAPPPATARATRKNQTVIDTTSDEQRFFPSFPAPASPYLNPFASGGSFGRPPLFPGPTANRAPSRFHPQFGPKYTQPHTNRGPGSAYPAESHDRYLHTNLLGSGNFEVVRGGTYYGDDDDGYHHTSGGTTGPGHYHQEDDDAYYHHNGHSSPHGYRNNPSAGGGDFFANFRDFADINPPTRSFSHHHETVADSEPHGSSSHEQPKNILDKLESSSDNIEVHQPYTASSSRDSDPMMATF